MSAVGEAITREFFEAHGFLVRQHRKYAVSARAKTADEEIDLLVVNPRAETPASPLSFVLKPNDLRSVSRAIVAVKGWYTESFGPALLTGAPEIWKFAEPAAVQEAAKHIGGSPTEGLLKLLIVPALPATLEAREKSIEFLRNKGVDGVLLFRDLLVDLVARVDTNKNYEKSDILQMLRLMKNYSLLKDPQLELFERKRKALKR